MGLWWQHLEWYGIPLGTKWVISQMCFKYAWQLSYISVLKPHFRIVVCNMITFTASDSLFNCRRNNNIKRCSTGLWRLFSINVHLIFVAIMSPYLELKYLDKISKNSWHRLVYYNSTYKLDGVIKSNRFSQENTFVIPDENRKPRVG